MSKVILDRKVVVGTAVAGMVVYTMLAVALVRQEQDLRAERAEAVALRDERDTALEFFHDYVVGDPQLMNQLLDGVRCYETFCDKSKGIRALGQHGRDRTGGVCGQAAGPYQVQPGTAVWLVHTGRLPYSKREPSCEDMKEFVMDEVRGRLTAQRYMESLLGRFGDVPKALCAYQHGPEEGLPWCKRAANVLAKVGD